MDMRTRRDVLGSGFHLLGSSLAFAGCDTRGSILEAASADDRRRLDVFARNGDTDDSASLRRAMEWAARRQRSIIELPGQTTLRISDHITLVSGVSLRGTAGSVIQQTRPAHRAIVGTDVSDVSLIGFSVAGIGALELFESERREDIDGVRRRTVSDAALVHIAGTAPGRSQRILIENLAVARAFNLLAVRNSNTVRIVDSQFSDWLLFGALASGSSDVLVARNRFFGCRQKEGFTAYAFSATGDGERGFPQCKLTFVDNHVRGVPSWDGFMTHEVDNLTVQNNVFEDVRNGIDVSSPRGRISDVRIVGNQVHHTAIDCWDGRSAAHFSIAVASDPGAAPAENIIVEGNILKQVNQVRGMSSGGYAIAALVFSNVRKLNVERNIMTIGDEDSRLGTPKGFDCISIYAPLGDISIIGNVAQGSLSRYFLELQLPTRASKVTNITVSDNQFTSTSSTAGFVRFVKGRFEGVRLQSNGFRDATGLRRSKPEITANARIAS